MNLLRACLAAAALLAAAPGTASAATAKGFFEQPSCDVKSSCSPGPPRVEYAAEPGEANRVRVIVEAGGAVVLEDLGAPLRGEGECRQRSEHVVACPPRAAVGVRLGDGDDAAEGGPGHDILDGGPGRDTLRGGDGFDELRDGDAAASADVFDGGAGEDLVTYAGRTDPLVIDLADPAPDGAPGEGDRIADVERVTGGAGDDVVAGTEGVDELAGGGGRDTLLARGGDDEVFAGETPGEAAGRTGDRIDAGAGDDQVLAGDGDDDIRLGPGRDTAGPGRGADHIDGGPGRDAITAPETDDPGVRIRCGSGADSLDTNGYELPFRVAGDCERLFPEGWEDAGSPLISLDPLLGSPRTTPVRVRQPRERGVSGAYALRAELRLVDPGVPRGRERVVGARQVVVRRPRGARPALRLSRIGRRLLARRGQLHVRLHVITGRPGRRVPLDRDVRDGFRFVLRLRR